MAFNELEEEVEQSNDGMPGAVKAMAVVAFLCLAGLVVYVAFSFEQEDPRFVDSERMWQERDPSATDDHETLRFTSEEPAAQPTMVPLSELPEPDRKRRVIGVEHDGVAHAYVIRRLEGKKNIFLAVAQVSGKAVLIMHNYRKDETRVMTADDSEQVMKTRLGGGDYLQNLVVLIGDNRFNQDSEKIPFDDYAFEKVSLADWVSKHPDTLVNFDEELFERDFFER